MIAARLALLVQSLEIRREIVDVLGVQKFSYNVRRLELSDSLYVLLYSAVVIALRVQMIAILTKYVDETLGIVLLALGNSGVN